jgi:hypothetical protein
MRDSGKAQDLKREEACKKGIKKDKVIKEKLDKLAYHATHSLQTAPASRRIMVMSSCPARQA